MKQSVNNCFFTLVDQYDTIEIIYSHAGIYMTAILDDFVVLQHDASLQIYGNDEHFVIRYDEIKKIEKKEFSLVLYFDEYIMEISGK